MKVDRKTRSIKALIFAMAMILVMVPVSVMGAESWQWAEYAGNPENNSVTSVNTIRNPEDAYLHWTFKEGVGEESHPTPPLVTDRYVYTAVKNQVFKLNKKTGKIAKKSPKLKGNIEWATNPMIYAEGRLYLQLNNGRIQCINAKTLNPEWLNGTGMGQSISNISYKKINGKGYVYTGTWVAYDKDGEFVAFDAEKGNIIWRFKPAKDGIVPGEGNNRLRGFYWAGAYVTDKYLAVGTDNGKGTNLYTVEGDSGATLYTLNPVSGKVIDSIYGIEGSIRTSICYYKGYLYFASENGDLHKCRVDTEGHLSNHSSVNLGGRITGTPAVTDSRIYVGTSGEGRYDSSSDHKFYVICNESELKDTSIAYSMPTPGFVASTPLVSTAYKNEGKTYVYYTCNASPGGIRYFIDSDDAKAPLVKPSEGGFYTPGKGKKQYCLSPIAVDSEGTMFFKNDSDNIFAVGKKTGDVSVTEGQWKKYDGKWWYKHVDGTFTESNWEKIDGRWYYFDRKGYSVTGWKRITGKWYHFGSYGMDTGWKKISGKWYHFGSYGMDTGWKKISGKWYHFGNQGMDTGWKKISGKWYYFGKDGRWIK